MDPKDIAKLVEAIAGQMKPMMADMVAGLMNAIQELNTEVAAMAKRLEKVEVESKSLGNNGYASGPKVMSADSLTLAVDQAWNRALGKMAGKAKAKRTPSAAAVKLFASHPRLLSLMSDEPATPAIKKYPGTTGLVWPNGEPAIASVDHYWQPEPGSAAQHQENIDRLKAQRRAIREERLRVVQGRESYFHPPALDED